MKVIDVRNIKCKIGNNAKENWQLLDSAKPYHLFVHLSSFSSPYLIAEVPDVDGFIPDINVLREIAFILKENTKQKFIPKVAVDITRCDNVTKTDTLGMVVFKSLRKVTTIKT